MVTITESAKEYLNSVRGNDYVSLGVQGGGCAGFQYIWGLKSDNPSVDWSDPIDDVLVVDPVAELYILGSTVDYVNELGGSFLSVKNPMSTSSCGCGESFGI
jgi:iron-sulfur cluster insertion protein|tara:strand:- start:490 stop:795 length:306 start_codon:yes stop_codon:yes gene_type:complete